MNCFRLFPSTSLSLLKTVFKTFKYRVRRLIVLPTIGGFYHKSGSSDLLSRLPLTQHNTSLREFKSTKVFYRIAGAPCIVLIRVQSDESTSVNPQDRIIRELAVSEQCEVDVEGGPSGHGHHFLGIELRILPQYCLLMLQRNSFNSLSTKCSPRPDGAPCSANQILCHQNCF